MSENVTLNDVKSARQAVDRAAASADQQLAQLVDSSGKRIYSEEQHAARVEQALKALREAQERAAALGRQGMDTAEREEAQQHADPTTWLTTEQLQAAGARAAFIREEAEALRPRELAQRGEAALASGDPVTVWLWNRYISQRLNQLQQSSARLSQDDTAIYGVARRLAEAAIPEAVKQRQANAEALRSAAADLSIYARQVLAERDGSAEQSRRAMREMISSW